MYRLTFDFYATEPRARLNAVFEREMAGKTEKLTDAGIWLAQGDLYSNSDADEILSVLAELIPVIGGILRARLAPTLFD